MPEMRPSTSAEHAGTEDGGEGQLERGFKLKPKHWVVLESRMNAEIRRQVDSILIAVIWKVATKMSRLSLW